MQLNGFASLGIFILAWFAFYLVAKAARLERLGLEISPLFMIYKSTRLNLLIERLAGLSPGFWRVFGNVSVASFFGQVAFMSYLLFQNLYRFIFVPAKASPVMPLIPGVTIQFSSLPMFLLVAGVVILFHELSHGVQCVVEGIQVKSAAIVFAVVTFGGAVEPDEESMEAASMISKLRVFAAGSFVNLLMGILVNVVFIFFGGWISGGVEVFMYWLFFLSINLALVNMLPVYPLDGGQMVRTYLASKPGWGRSLERVTMYGFVALMASNLILSLVRFGLIPI
ncbi:MAG TPA: site-2 protease family protein [Patescibacteria group bacterium]|nr:site-2 protease family protein [Patescibacteria group bacterium]